MRPEPFWIADPRASRGLGIFIKTCGTLSHQLSQVIVTAWKNSLNCWQWHFRSLSINKKSIMSAIYPIPYGIMGRPFGGTRLSFQQSRELNGSLNTFYQKNNVFYRIPRHPNHHRLLDSKNYPMTANSSRYIHNPNPIGTFSLVHTGQMYFYRSKTRAKNERREAEHKQGNPALE